MGLSYGLAPGAQFRMFALAADHEGDENNPLQAFGDSTIDETNNAEIERFCEEVAERTGGEFVLVVDEAPFRPSSAPYSMETLWKRLLEASRKTSGRNSPKPAQSAARR